MQPISQLGAALAAVPVAQPCTAAAVRALHVEGHAAARQLAPAMYLGMPAVAFMELQEACTRQQLPGACMPVLAWLADGLSSGLPAATSLQAHDMVCVLLGVVSLVVPSRLQTKLWDDAGCDQQTLDKAVRLLQQLGGNLEDVCRQLAKVAAVLVGLLPPTTTTSSSSSSSSRALSLQQLASQAGAWLQLSYLIAALTGVPASNGASMVPAVTAVTGSGLFRVMLEGTLLLLAQDPAGYPQASRDEGQVFDYLSAATMAALALVTCTGGRALAAWWAANMVAPASLISGLAQAQTSIPVEPWMAPMFKVQVLMLAKMQWDVRQCPEDAVTDKVRAPWPRKYLTPGVVSSMVSPCVAGDLLRQRAPGLVPHSYTCQQLVTTLAGQRKEAVERRCLNIPHGSLGHVLELTGRCIGAYGKNPVTCAAVVTQDLALLLEVAELYSLVSPPGPAASVSSEAWSALQRAVTATPYPVLARFAATCGEALLGITEYLVEDVLLVASGAVAGATASAAGARSSAGSSAATSSANGSASSSDTQMPPGASTGSGSSGSGSRKHRPRMGGRNPKVTLDHRAAWAQDTITTLSWLMWRQDFLCCDSRDDCTYLEHEGYGVGVAHSLFTCSTAPRLLRLLEVALRTPELQGPRMQYIMSLLPVRLPLLQLPATSLAGSRALLSAVTSATKRQQVEHAVMSALVLSSGQPAPAAAAVAAAVPGRMGQAVAQQVLRQPDLGLLLHAAWLGGAHLVTLAMKLMERAAALLDPVLAPLAAYVAATRLPPGQDSKPWAVEAVLMGGTWMAHKKGQCYAYKQQLAVDSLHMSGIMADLRAALSLHLAAAAGKQAEKLAKAAGGGAAEAEVLRQQLQGMWLGSDGDEVPGLSTTDRQGLAAAGSQRPPVSTATTTSSSGSNNSPAPAAGLDQLPRILQDMCRKDIFQQEEVLAAGDPSRWSSALGPTSEDDLRVASTALLAACKAAGAVEQLPTLLQQLQPILQEHPLGRALSSRFDPDPMSADCARVADWALQLAPLLAPLLPAQQAAELQEVAGGVQRNAAGAADLPLATTARVLGLLGHVVVPGAPGCSYPGCCNLEGCSEAELPTQVCSKCRGARYCCREHQVAHWKAGHKEVCRAAQAAAQQVKGTADVGG